MPKSFATITTDHNGEVIFLSSQDSITNFFSGPLIKNYEGVCLSLVMMWLAQDTAKKSPLDGTPNKTAALNLQSKMETNWNGFETVKKQGNDVIQKHFWWKADNKESLTTGDPTKYLLNDPQHKRDGLHIFVLYPDNGTAHAIGVWRFPSGAVAVYDPNHGACVQRGPNLSAFLKEFTKELYPEMAGFAVCSWYSDPNG
jgi:hypothetical protein